MSTAAGSPRSGEVAASVEAVTDVLDHLTVTTHQVHHAIARRGIGGVLPMSVRSAQDAVTAVVYGIVRAGIAVAGHAATRTLESVERTRTARPWTSTPRGRRLGGMLNGAFGDRLADRYPPLASTMRIRIDGEDLEPDPAALALHYPTAATSVVVFIHGVIETDEWWSGSARARAGAPAAIGEDFGTRLARDLGCSTVQIRYNSGRHVSDNGTDLADLLERLLTAWPRPVRRLALVGHSMGGLVARSAMHQAFEQGLTWPHSTRHLICLGTPHTGAPLERGANTLAWGLRQFDESAPLAALLAARSAGIKDMRHGSLHQQDWHGADPDALHRGRAPHPYQPPATVRHSNLAAPR
jgi:pimeloyl-ACP methyl ester carboxylesterase